MPKPFSLQSPEDIAKEYGGNKQKIAQAMQMGVVDPTAGTLAGMFIDRMRGAQMQEMAQTPTVAQQVFAPPQPPMGAPPMGGMPPAPPMGAPPMGGMPPAPPMGAPPAPPMGMAEGGIAALPVPDMMFDEPDNGGYAGGGIVAFNEGGPTSFYGMSTDLGANLDTLEGRLKPETEFTEREAQYIRDVLSPEGQKKRRDEDKWFALAQLGATMASTPGSLLQAASAGAQAALPGLREGAKERRAEERQAISTGAARELGRNKEQRELLSTALGMVDKAGGFAEAAKTREFQATLNKMDNDTRELVARIGAGASVEAANIYAGAQRDSSPLKLAADIQAKIQSEAQDAVNEMMKNEGPAFTEKQKAAQDARRQQLYTAEVAKRANAYASANPLFAQMLGIAPGGAEQGAQVGAVPGGKIVVQNGRRVFVPGG
jgi:hypothetical protein